MNRKLDWKGVYNRNLTNLKVLSINGVEVGFIWKPLDDGIDRNAWRCHRVEDPDIGYNDEDFLGHSWTEEGAMDKVEEHFEQN